MNEQLKRYIDPVVRFWKSLTKKTKIIIYSILGSLVAAAIILNVLLSLPSYVVLYPNMDTTEVLEVIQELNTRGIDYQEKEGTIYVRKEDENSIRGELANEGYPKSTLNYDFFLDNVDVLTTDYQKRIIEKYQLNQRLEAVIEAFDDVKDASVTISIGDSSGYAWDTSGETSTASVAITMNAGKTMDATQVNGVKQLVAKSVPNMTAEDVAVVDTSSGKELSSTKLSSVDLSDFKLAIENEYESEIEDSVIKVLQPLYGENNVHVTAKAVMDVDKKIKEIITYIPSGDGNTGVIEEEDKNHEEELTGDGTGGTVGSDSNADDTTYSGVTTDGDTIYIKDEKSYKYLVSQAKEQIESDAASLKDMTISVIINRETIEEADRTNIAKLVAYAAAIDPAKVAVYNSVFTLPDVDEPVITPPSGIFSNIEMWALWAIAAVVGLLVILVIFFIVLSAHRRKKLRALMAVQAEEETQGTINRELEQMEEEAARKRRALEALHEAQRGREDDLRHDLQEFTNTNPEIVAQLIRSWVRGEENDG